MRKLWIPGLLALFLFLSSPVHTARAEDAFAVQSVTTYEPSETAFSVEVIRPVSLGKRVLIYHTHTWEAFEQVPGDAYVPTEKWRTKDNRYNMVAVGKALSAALCAMGFDVTHDTTAFEPPSLSSSYTRSLKMLEERLSRGESYDLYIDLHRDAFASASAIQRTVTMENVALARFMVLVGRGDGYEKKPDWQANEQLAQKITDCLNSQCEGLARDVKIKTGRFNQHIAPCCILIECGSNYNTLEEVLSAIPYLACAIRDALCPQEDFPVQAQEASETFAQDESN